MSSVVQLPSRIQMNFGFAPRKRTGRAEHVVQIPLESLFDASRAPIAISRSTLRRGDKLVFLSTIAPD